MNTEYQDNNLHYNTIYNKVRHMECSICLEYMVYDIAILSCLHNFHTNCIIAWFTKKDKSICPICNNIVFISNTLNKKINYTKSERTRKLPIIPFQHPLYHISTPNTRLNRNVPPPTNWLCCMIL